MRSIIIFYSKSGNTTLVANTIKKSTNAHIKEINDYWNHKTVLDYLFPTIFDSAQTNNFNINIDYYETIFIGTPVWFGSVTPAIVKFIKNTDFKGKNVVLFNTMKLVGGESSIKRLSKIVNESGGNVISAFSIKTNTNKEEIIKNTNRAIKDLII